MIKPVIVAACDIEYFKEHALALCLSSERNGHDVQILVGGPLRRDLSLDEMQLIENFHKGFSSHVRPVIFCNFSSHLDIVDDKAFYAALRFLCSPRFSDENILILDIDCFLNKEILIPNDIDIGLFLRENNTIGSNKYEIEGMKVAAGALYISKRSSEFSQLISEYLTNNQLIWFSDQHAIYNAYKKLKNSYKILDFSKLDGFLDWNFNPDSTIWTGKGDRKYTNLTYINRKKEIENGKEKNLHLEA